MLFLIRIKSSDYQGILIKNIINKIAFVFKDKSSDKKFSDAIMKILKLSLIRNGPATREYFVLLSPSLQSKLIDYAEKNDPDILSLLNEEAVEIDDGYDDQSGQDGDDDSQEFNKSGLLRDVDDYSETHTGT